MEAEGCSMDVEEEEEEEEEDVVVKEFDVYIHPSLDADTKLYCMQYPLRPSWRPYELDERLEEIRIKPKLSHFEIDLSLNVDDNENYDKQVDDSLVLPKQTLSSESSPANEFAVGFLIGNQFHLNPLHAIVRFLPLLDRIDFFQTEKQGDAHLKSNLNPVKVANKESLKASDNKGKTVLEDANAVNENIDANEPWVLLEYHSVESPASCFYKEKAVVEERNQIQFAMNSSGYLSSYGKASTGSIRKATGPSMSSLLTKPLEHRLNQWLSEGPQVNRFSVLLHLAPTDSVEDVLRLLQSKAYLVQGLWVSNSSLFCRGNAALYRDYILLQFSKNRAVHESKLNIANTEFKRWLKTFAVRRSSFKDWKFKEDPDSLFIKNYPEIVNSQAHAWSIREKIIQANLFRVEKSIPSKMNSAKPGISSKAIGSIEPCHNKERNNVSSLAATIPTTGQDTLAKAVMELLCLHKVLSLNSIIQGLQEKTNADLHEVESVASRIAIKLHDVYVLKSSGKQALDQFRNFVIEHLNVKGRNAKLKKKEIKSAAQVHLQKDVSDAEYSQVMNELCMTSGGSWVLKSGALS